MIVVCCVSGITKMILDREPYHHGCLPIHLASLVELGMKTELYYCAHKLVDDYADKAVSWYIFIGLRRPMRPS